MQQHLNKAKHNEKFLSLVENNFPDNYFDWKITIAFYIAIHYIDAYFASLNDHIHSHEQRRHKLEFGANSVSLTFIDNYDNLYNICRNARYNGFKDEATFSQFQKTKLVEAKKYLKFIKNYIKDELDQIA
jgi:predicted metal-dependent hydrolase